LLCGSCNVARNTTQPNTENRIKCVRRLLLILQGGAYGRGWISILIAQWSMPPSDLTRCPRLTFRSRLLWAYRSSMLEIKLEKTKSLTSDNSRNFQTKFNSNSIQFISIISFNVCSLHCDFRQAFKLQPRPTCEPQTYVSNSVANSLSLLISP
jgi:hypothetical protein